MGVVVGDRHVRMRTMDGQKPMRQRGYEEEPRAVDKTTKPRTRRARSEKVQGSCRSKARPWPAWVLSFLFIAASPHVTLRKGRARGPSSSSRHHGVPARGPVRMAVA